MGKGCKELLESNGSRRQVENDRRQGLPRKKNSKKRKNLYVPRIVRANTLNVSLYFTEHAKHYCPFTPAHVSTEIIQWPYPPTMIISTNSVNIRAQRLSRDTCKYLRNKRCVRKGALELKRENIIEILLKKNKGIKKRRNLS